MGPPLENILMRRYNINYASARNLVADGRVILKMKKTDPWTEELRLECQRLFEAKYGPPLAERLKQEAAALETPKKQQQSETEEKNVDTPATAPLTPNAENDFQDPHLESLADVTNEVSTRRDVPLAAVKEKTFIEESDERQLELEDHIASTEDLKRVAAPEQASPIFGIAQKKCHLPVGTTPQKGLDATVDATPQKESDVTVDATETVASNSVGFPHEIEMAMDRQSKKEKKKKGLFGWMRKSKKGVKSQ